MKVLASLFVVLHLVLQTIQKKTSGLSLLKERTMASQKRVLQNSETRSMIVSTLNGPEGYHYANCTAKYSSGSRLPELKCKPVQNYTYTTEARNLDVIKTERHEQGRGFVGFDYTFTDDCWGTIGSDSAKECFWVTHCARDSSFFGFNCTVSRTNLALNLTKSEVFFSSGYYHIDANCTVSYTQLQNGTIRPNLDCVPTADYTYVTKNREIKVEEFKWSGYGSYSHSKIFSTDSFGPNRNDYAWITKCRFYQRGYLGFDCEVKKSTPPEEDKEGNWKLSK